MYDHNKWSNAWDNDGYLVQIIIHIVYMVGSFLLLVSCLWVSAMPLAMIDSYSTWTIS